MNTTELQTKAGWLEECIRARNGFSEMATEEEQMLQYVHLYCKVDPETGSTNNGDGGIYVYAFLYEESPTLSFSDAKDGFSCMVRTHAVAGNAFASITLSEAWMSALAADSGVAPSESSDRKEVLICSTTHREFGSRMWQALIDRDGDERTIGEWRDCGGDFSGRLADFIPPVEPPGLAQLGARQLINQLNKQHREEL